MDRLGAIDATYHACEARYARPYLAELAYRFDRRYKLADLVPRLVYVAVRTPPLPNRLLTLAGTAGSGSSLVNARAGVIDLSTDNLESIEESLDGWRIGRGGGRHQFDYNRSAVNSRTYLVEIDRKRNDRYEHPNRKQGMNLNMFSSSPDSCTCDKVAADTVKPTIFLSLGPMGDPKLSDIPLIEDHIGASPGDHQARCGHFDKLSLQPLPRLQDDLDRRAHRGRRQHEPSFLPAHSNSSYLGRASGHSEQSTKQQSNPDTHSVPH